jgi:hypothetical protein
MGFCSQACASHAQQDGLVKDMSFDPMGYKELRSLVKQGKLSEDELADQVRSHIQSCLHDITFPHQTSQKEEHVDRCLLEEVIA